MKIVFFGTPYYVIPVLDSLHKTFRTKVGEMPIVAVVTQEPRPSGRDKQLSYSEVDHWAHKKQTPIYFDAKEIIKAGVEADLGVLASFGQILPKEVINYFRYGIINLHPSLLPKFRGASPVQATLATGEKVTGLSFTKMDTTLDRGFLISQFKEDVLTSDTTQTLRDRLFLRASEVIETLIPAYVEGKTKLKKLEVFPGTFTWQIKSQDAFIDPKYIKSALEGKSLHEEMLIKFISNCSLPVTPDLINNFIRAMIPWPTSWTSIKIGKEKKRLKLHKSHTEEGKLILDEVQLEGKNTVSWEQFKTGYPQFKFE